MYRVERPWQQVSHEVDLLIWIHFIEAWISNHMYSKVWHDTTYVFQNVTVALFGNG